MLLEAAIIAQTSNFMRWEFATIMLYFVLPAIIFPVSGEDMLERFFTRFIRMVVVTIVMGYILAALKLYEGLSLFFVLLVVIVLFRIPTNQSKRVLREMKVSLFVRLYDFLDGTFDPHQSIRRYFSRNFRVVKDNVAEWTVPTQSIQTVLLLSVLAYSGYLRFYDTLQHAAPSFSDAYVTLAWMKYIEGKMLFHDGIYPQGFYIFLSVLHEIASNDPLYVMKYTGPFNGVLITLGIYLFVAKVTGNKLAGIISAFVFGVLGGILPGGWDRQGGTLVQEFGMVFLLPAWYYASVFLKTGKKHYAWTAGAAFAAIGLVHTLILAFLWLGLVYLVCACLITDFKNTVRSARYLIVTGFVAGVIAALQVPVGWLAGKTIFSEAIKFMTATQTEQYFPSMTTIDKLALLGFFLFLGISLWKRRENRFEFTLSLFICFLGVSSFMLYIAIGPMSGNVLLQVRSGVLWSLLASVGVGVAAAAFFQIIPDKQTILNLGAYVLTLSIMAWFIIHYKPLPCLPYKMQYDAEINQYLRITNECTPAEWTLVSNEEGYDLALGRGWHIHLEDFLAWYDPKKSKLTKSVDGKEEPLVAKDIFIVKQKRIFEVNMKVMEPILAKRVLNYKNLETWVTTYKEKHNNLTIYYEDDYIVIYHIQNLDANLQRL